LAMVVDDPANRIFGIRKLGGRVDERATPETRSAARLPDSGRDRAEWIRVARQSLKPSALRSRLALEVGDDEVALVAEVAVEGDLRDADLLDDAVGTRRADTGGVELLVGGGEDARARRRGRALCRGHSPSRNLVAPLAAVRE